MNAGDKVNVRMDDGKTKTGTIIRQRGDGSYRVKVGKVAFPRDARDVTPYVKPPAKKKGDAKKDD